MVKIEFRLILLKKVLLDYPAGLEKCLYTKIIKSNQNYSIYKLKLFKPNSQKKLKTRRLRISRLRFHLSNLLFHFFH